MEVTGVISHLYMKLLYPTNWFLGPKSWVRNLLFLRKYSLFLGAVNEPAVRQRVHQLTQWGESIDVFSEAKGPEGFFLQRDLNPSMVSYDLNMSLFIFIFFGCEQGIDAHITNTEEWLWLIVVYGRTLHSLQTSHDLEELRIGQFPNHFQK